MREDAQVEGIRMFAHGDTVFLAIRLKGQPAEDVLRLQTGPLTEGCANARFVPRSCLHMTLHPIECVGGSPSRIVERTIAAAATVVMPSFVVCLNRLSNWSGRKEGDWIYVLTGDDGVIGVELLHDAIRRALAEARLLRRSYRLTPHVTVLRGRTWQPDRIIAPVQWRVSEFALIHSLVGQSRHVVLGRWPLPLASAPSTVESRHRERIESP